MTIATLMVELVVPLLAWAPYPLFAYSTDTRASFSTYSTDTRASSSDGFSTDTRASAGTGTGNSTSTYSTVDVLEIGSKMMSVALFDGSAARLVQASR